LSSFELNTRLAGGNKGPNHTAVVVVISLFLSQILILREKSKRIYCIVYQILASIAIIFTNSLTGMIGLLVFILLIIKTHNILKYFAAFGLVGLLIFFGDISSISEVIIKFVTGDASFLQNKYYGSFQDRLFIWLVALEVILDNPFGGIGIGNWLVIYNEYIPNYNFSSIDSVAIKEANQFFDQYGFIGNTQIVHFSGTSYNIVAQAKQFMIPESAHNSFLGIAIELGIVGLILYLSPILYAVRKLLVSSKYSSEKNIAQIFLYTISVMLIFLFVIANTEYSKVLVFLISNIIHFNKRHLLESKLGSIYLTKKSLLSH